MGQSRGKKAEPSLELPSIPGFGRRKKAKKEAPPAAPPDLPEETVESPDVEAQTAEYSPGASAAEDTGEDVDVLTEEPGPRRRATNAKKQRRQEKRQKVREPRTTPAVPGRLAAALTGLVVGAAGAGGTYAAMAGCKAVRGVSSCGGAPGFFILVAIVVLMILLGTGLLKLLGVGDPGSTSFLAVGLVAVIAMLVLLDVIFSVTMFVVIPVLSAVSFVLAHWVTTRFADDKGRRDWT